MNTEVLIVGAGPTGLALAAQLIRFGIDFIIVDPKPGTTDLSKALVVHARTLEIFDQLGLAEKAVQAGAIMNKGVVHIDAEKRAEVDFENFGKDLSKFPFALILEQSKTERLLADFVLGNEKIVWWQTALESLEQTESGVTARVTTSAGETQEIAARYAVGCDGAGSKTRGALGIDFAGETDARRFYVADVVMETTLDRHNLQLFFGGDAFCLIAAFKEEKHWRLIGNLPASDAPDAPNKDAPDDEEIAFEEIAGRIETLTKQALEIKSVNWFSTYKIHTRRAEKFQLGRVFLAGDAAHIHTPAGGQGMNTGIQDVYNLAWKLAFVLRFKADASLLETYNEERVENAERLLRSTDELFSFMTGKRWYARLLRDNIMPNLAAYALKTRAARNFVFPLISQIGISYDKDSLSRHNPSESFKVKAGNRFPYFICDGRNVFETLGAPKCHLLLFSDGKTDLSTVAAEIAEKYGDLTDVEILPLYPFIADLFGAARSFAVFVRPDGHIGFITHEDARAALAQYAKDNLKIPVPRAETENA